MLNKVGTATNRERLRDAARRGVTTEQVAECLAVVEDAAKAGDREAASWLRRWRAREREREKLGLDQPWKPEGPRHSRAVETNGAPETNGSANGRGVSGHTRESE